MKFVRNFSKVFTCGSVVANGLESAEIGAEILRKGGTAVDAAIATSLAEGISTPHACGLGGGFFMTVYIRHTKHVETLIARERAPRKAAPDMFVKDPACSVHGGLSIAVPGMLKGYWEAHQRYGRLSWEQLVEPSIRLCEEGHKVSKFLGQDLIRHSKCLEKEELMKAIFFDPKTNKPWKEGDTIKRPKLAETLKVIAAEGPSVFHMKEGSLLKKIVEDIQAIGGIIDEEDLLSYQTQWSASEILDLGTGEKVCTAPLPGLGILLRIILKILKRYELDDTSKSWHRIIESFKFAFAERSKLGDPIHVSDSRKIVRTLRSSPYARVIRQVIDEDRTYDSFKHYGANFIPKEDKGTSNICVMAPNGDAVCLTESINTGFGSMKISPNTGILFNNHMNDFSTIGIVNEYGIPASSANSIAPKKRPLSSMMPTIVLGPEGNVKMVIGASGGSKITTSMALVMGRILFFHQNLGEAIGRKRLHHQLFPNELEVEEGFDAKIIEELKERGHKVKEINLEHGFNAVTGIMVRNGEIQMSYDPRRGGSIAIV